MDRICSVPGCERRHKARGMCYMHYRRYRNTGSVNPVSPEQRFWRMVDRSGDCWLWTGYVMPNGYGQFGYGGRGGPKPLAHRFAYELAFGAIPDGLHIDHLCRTRACVRAVHLEAVTQAENNRRANALRWARRDQLHAVGSSDIREGHRA